MTETNSLIDYFNKLAQMPLLTEDEEKALFARIEKGDEKARETLIVRNIRLAFKVAKDYVKTGIPLADLVQEGSKAIVKACDRFKSEKNVRFSTYATLWIQQHIGRYVKKHVKNIFIPEYVMNLARRIHRIMREEETAEHGVPSPAKICNILKEKYNQVVDVKTVKETLEYCQSETSIFTKVGDDGETELGDLLTDTNSVDPSTQTSESMANTCLVNAINSLDADERFVLGFRYGIGQPGPLSVKDIAQMFNIDEDEVRNIAKETFTNLKISASEISEILAA